MEPTMKKKDTRGVMVTNDINGIDPGLIRVESGNMKTFLYQYEQKISYIHYFPPHRMADVARGKKKR